MKKDLVLAGSGCELILDLDRSAEGVHLCEVYIKCDKIKKKSLGLTKTLRLIERFTWALTFSKKEIEEIYSDPSKKGNTTLIKMFGSKALATCEYLGDDVVIQWEEGKRQVLGTTKLNKVEQQNWLEEFEKLKVLLSCEK